jgi:hypothetical protein
MLDRTQFTAILVAVVGFLGAMLAQRVTSVASTGVWRLLAFVCLLGGMAIALLSDPVYVQAKLHPKAAILLTVAVITGTFVLVRTRLFEARAASRCDMLCMRVETQVDDEAQALDCQFTMSIDLTNDGPIKTTIRDFRFFATWKGVAYPGQQILGLDQYELRSFRPSDIGLNTRHTPETEPLFDFPIPYQLDVHETKRGWLRFFIRGFPLEGGRHSGLHDDVRLTLLAFDKRPHRIYKGAIPRGECGPIVKKETTGGLSRLQITLLDMIDKGKSSFSPGDFYSETDYFDSVRKFQMQANELVRLQAQGYIRRLLTTKDSLEGQLYIDRVIVIEGITAEGHDALKMRSSEQN